MFSVLRSSHRHQFDTFEDVEPGIQTGDIFILLTESTKQSRIRLAVRQATAQSGFIVRRDDGTAGLFLCHAFFKKGSSSNPRTQLSSITDMLQGAPSSTVVIRKLCVPLSEEQKTRVIQFAEDNQGTPVAGRAMVLMQRPELACICAPIRCINCSRRTVERFICSDLVARMLVHADRIQQSSRSVYVPKTTDSTTRRLCETALFQTSVIVTSSSSPPPSSKKRR